MYNDRNTTALTKVWVCLKVVHMFYELDNLLLSVEYARVAQRGRKCV